MINLSHVLYINANRSLVDNMKHLDQYRKQHENDKLKSSFSLDVLNFSFCLASLRFEFEPISGAINTNRTLSLKLAMENF